MIKTTTTEVLRLSDQLALPRSMITHVVGILAMRGMGKSYAASVLMEEMVRQGLFVGFVDPLGIAWGIRSSIDGEHEGLPVVIFGGRRGDVPLDPAAGKIVAQTVLDMRQPYILDLSLFDTEDQQRTFLADFIDCFRSYEQVLMHLIVDEADLFAPQIPQSTEARRSLTAMQALVRRFRFKGMGATIISQRPAELYKGILQLDLLIALGMTTPQDIKALDEWIKRNATEAERQTFLSTLSTLPIGEAWAWSPQWLHIFERIKVRTRTTFDSSKTPEVDGELIAPKHLTEINLDTLSAQIEALRERARETDPVLLHKRIQELEEQLRARSAKDDGSHQARTEKKQDGAKDRELAEARRRLEEKEQEIKRLQRKCTDLEKIQASINGTNVSLVDVPTYLRTHGLHIDTATITIGRTNGAETSVQPSLRSSVPSQVHTTVHEKSQLENVKSRNVGGISDQEQKTLNRLLKKMKELTGNEQAIFTWLLNHDQQWVQRKNLARALSISISALRADRTDHLDKIEFIQHIEGRFRATFAEYAQVAFESTENVEAVKQAFLDAVR